MSKSASWICDFCTMLDVAASGLAGFVPGLFVADLFATRHPVGGRKADLDVLGMSGSSFEREHRDNKGG